MLEFLILNYVGRICNISKGMKHQNLYKFLYTTAFGAGGGELQSLPTTPLIFTIIQQFNHSLVGRSLKSHSNTLHIHS